MAFAAPYVRWPKIKLVIRVAFKTSMHANVLAPARCGRLDGTLLLLTWLGVRACPAPRTVHLCRPPRQRKPWRGPSYSWIILRRRTRLTNGGPLSRASSASPTATLRGNQAIRCRGKTAGRGPVATRTMGVQLPCTLRQEGQDRRLAGSTPTAAPPRHRTHELVATSAKFSMNDNKKTLALASSAEEKRDVNLTSALGPLSICARWGNRATCRTR